MSFALQDGLEPTTPWLTVRCSNQLSYWSKFGKIPVHFSELLCKSNGYFWNTQYIWQKNDKKMIFCPDFFATASAICLWIGLLCGRKALLSPLFFVVETNQDLFQKTLDLFLTRRREILKRSWLFFKGFCLLILLQNLGLLLLIQDRLLLDLTKMLVK